MRFFAHFLRVNDGFLGGRLLSMKGEFIYYSKPYDYGLHDPDEDYIPLGKRVRSRSRSRLVCSWSLIGHGFIRFRYKVCGPD